MGTKAQGSSWEPPGPGSAPDADGLGLQGSIGYER